MKKLVLLSIVLAISSVSLAGIALEGPGTIELGSTVKMEILTLGQWR